MKMRLSGKPKQIESNITATKENPSSLAHKSKSFTAPKNNSN